MHDSRTARFRQDHLDTHLTERYGVSLTAVELQLFELADSAGSDDEAERLRALVTHAVALARTLAPAPLAVGLVCRDPIEGWVAFLARHLGRGLCDAPRHRNAQQRLESVLEGLLDVARSREKGATGETDRVAVSLEIQDGMTTATDGRRAL